MHEFTLAQGIFDTIDHYIKDKNIKTVLSVRLKIGKLRKVLPESLIFCFGVIAKDSKAEEAKIIIENVDIIGRCKSCMSEFIIHNYSFVCDNCGHSNVELIKGNELFIESMEVEDGD